MARLRDILPAARAVGPLTLCKRIFIKINEDNVFAWGSALAYAWLFAVFPFFLFVLTLIPYLPQRNKEDTKHQIAVVVYRLPKEAADTIWINIYDKLDAILNSRPKGLASVGLLVTLWAASGGMAMTMGALDTAYDVKEHRKFYVQRPLAIVLTIVTTIMILLVMVLIPIGTVVQGFVLRNADKIDWLHKHQKLLTPIYISWQVVRFGLGFALMFAILAAIYGFGPNVRRQRRLSFLSPGAVFSVAGWILLGASFRYYIDHFARYDKTYGTVGGVAILLLFFYFDSVILLIGAEINSEIDRALHRVAEPPAPPPNDSSAVAAPALDESAPA